MKVQLFSEMVRPLLALLKPHELTIKSDKERTNCSNLTALRVFSTSPLFYSSKLVPSKAYLTAVLTMPCRLIINPPE